MHKCRGLHRGQDRDQLSARSYLVSVYNIKSGFDDVFDAVTFDHDFKREWTLGGLRGCAYGNLHALCVGSSTVFVISHAHLAGLRDMFNSWFSVLLYGLEQSKGLPRGRPPIYSRCSCSCSNNKEDTRSRTNSTTGEADMCKTIQSRFAEMINYINNDMDTSERLTKAGREGINQRVQHWGLEQANLGGKIQVLTEENERLRKELKQSEQ
ncbi:hypothetical protein JTB14_016126 [Gonioctena quinquepunctata]|nr:hypothetical protein JTB14_016126 [Gonioctena quinquepunctata]